MERQLGRTGPRVFPLALGCMGFSGAYGPAGETESLATIHAALDAGIMLLDTADFYGAGHNELLIGRILHSRRDQVVLSVKFGGLRAPSGDWLGFDGRPASVKNSLTYSLRRLGVDHIDIYRPARLDPDVPIEDTIGAIVDLIQGGYVRGIGLSEVGPNTITRAHAVHPITDLQIEYSLISRGPEMKILPLLEELDIGLTAYGVLARGLLTGSRPTNCRDIRLNMPRFQADNERHNSTVVEDLHSMATAKGVTPAQLAIAWVLAKGAAIVPVIGARTQDQLTDALGAVDISLTPTEIEHLERRVSPHRIRGARYPDHMMAALDSEQ